MDITGYNDIFDDVITNYHRLDDVDQPLLNAYSHGNINNLLYQKCWIDTVQWHFEDLIRDENIDPVEALALKRRIDKSNQDRTDLVEQIDDYFFHLFSAAPTKKNARLNTETPAWAIDRLSILALKIFHMREETERPDASAEHVSKCSEKLQTLLTQRKYLTSSISSLLTDVQSGDCVSKTYKQMKMYNDKELNPVLRAQK